MTYYIGIDLGTTNSAISVFDGENVRVYKSRQGQNDVTPSNIYIDAKGKQFVGKKAYDQLGNQATRVAKQFKRFMGTGTQIEFAGISMSPVECSAEILKELVRCLPEDIVESDDKATVITVPASFDQRQNAATEQAAKLANLGKVALMQEPVAAIMRAVKDKNKNGCFLVFDIGGGTLDCAIATNYNGKVDIVAHGGVAMCGGADMDLKILDKIIIPWMHDNYSLPENIRGINKYEKMLKVARFYAEQAKIELSSAETAEIYGSLKGVDEDGEEIELDIELSREEYNNLIDDLINEAIEAARDTIKKSSLSSTDFDRIVFIGGPANYKYLRDRVERELGIKSEGLEVNPMTAVSEGAAIFAETIDWSSDLHDRKANYSQVKTSSELGLDFKYDSRTTKDSAKIMAKVNSNVNGYKLQICSTDTGWDSGLVPLVNGQRLNVQLAKMGINTFEIFVYDNASRKIRLENSVITITKVNANVGAILASHSLGIEVKDSAFNDAISLDYIVREGDRLPVKGQRTYKATETVKSGSENSIRFIMREGDISGNVTDNRFVGCMKISGSDLEYGSIKAGTELIVDYTIDEAMTVNVDVTIESLDVTFNSGKNFYAYEDGQKDMNDEDTVKSIVEDAYSLLNKVEQYSEKIEDERLDKIRNLTNEAIALEEAVSIEPENVKKNSDNLIHAKKILDQIRKDNLQEMRETELDEINKEFNDIVIGLLKDVEKQKFKNMIRAASNSISSDSKEFESIINVIRGEFFGVRFWRDDKYAVGIFKYLRDTKYKFINKNKAEKLLSHGEEAIQDSDYDELRETIRELVGLLRMDKDAQGFDDISNIMRG